jgi:putative SOS response-associated peptidase YedK
LVEPLCTLPPKYNGAPGQERWGIRQPQKIGERTLDRPWWGLIPYCCEDSSGGRRPINAKDGGFVADFSRRVPPTALPAPGR